MNNQEIALDGNIIIIWPSRREGLNSMIQGKNITINGGKFNNVGGDYHEHNTYAIKESATRPKYLKRILGQYYIIKFIYP